MLKLVVSVLLVLFSWSAFAAGTPITFPAGTTFLVEPNTVTAQSRSQSQCAALGCDGTLTQYWWAVQPLTDGTAALVISPTDPFGVTTTNKIAKTPTGLSPTEQSAVVPYSSIQALLPVVSSPAAAQVGP